MCLYFTFVFCLNGIHRAGIAYRPTYVCYLLNHIRRMLAYVKTGETVKDIVG